MPAGIAALGYVKLVEVGRGKAAQWRRRRKETEALMAPGGQNWRVTSDPVEPFAALLPSHGYSIPMIPSHRLPRHRQAHDPYSPQPPSRSMSYPEMAQS